MPEHPRCRPVSGRLAVVVTAVVMALALGLGGCVAVLAEVVGGSTLGGAGGGDAAGAGGGGGVSGGVPAVPAVWESLEVEAVGAECPGLPWGVLAAIGRVESDSGRSDAPGVHSGANSAGAEGPMQFEARTFALYATVGPGGVAPASPYDPVDAVYTAATMLCADGGATAGGLGGAVWDYNHSTAYVDTVLVLAQSLEDDPPLASVPAAAVAFAAAQLGTPYVWGGTGAGSGGFDCSGLVQAAYRSAGVSLPRVAQSQFDAGPQLPATAALDPGDLVFFGTGAAGVSHVGIVIGGGRMIDAPHTGADVRVEAYDWPDRVGATRPA
jgi:cell wall-associated NlpC family hydrolase